jgi:hypothetical protein
MNNLIFVDVEAAGPCPSKGKMTEFGAVHGGSQATFHGVPDSVTDGRYGIEYSWWDTARRFKAWLTLVVPTGRPIFVSDNPAFDWQWMNDFCWKHFNENPFGHSARRISDFYAGLTGDFRNTQKWKKMRITPHDHNPVHDAQGNKEAFIRMLAGER